jgi:hypothetical protein
MNSQVMSSSIRNRILLIVAVVVLLAIPEVLPATPVQLVFTGTVTSIDGGV